MRRSGRIAVRRRGASLILALLLVAAAAPAARAQDSLAPPGAEPHWLPNEEWVNNLWLPYDEQRLYDALGASRGEIFRWVRNDAAHTLAQLARRRGRSVDAVASRLVAGRRASSRQRRVLLRAARRTLTQGHLAQHLLFHALHQTAVAASAQRIFGVHSQEQFLDLRRAELSPLQIGDLHGRTRTEMRRGVVRALEAAAARGVRRGFLTREQKRLLLDRQLRQVPRWLGQRRYNGPTGGRNRPDLPPGDGAKRPGISADGALVTWDAYRYEIPKAERFGEIHVQGARTASPGRGRGMAFAISAPSDARSREPVASYNSAISPDGTTAVFETAESTFPLAKRVGQMSILARDLRSGKTEKVSHASLAPGAPTRSAFNPSLSADGRLVAYEATDSASATTPSRNGLFVYDRAALRERLLVEHGTEGAAFLPRISADGGSVVYTDANGTGDGRTLVWLVPAGGGQRVLVSRAEGPDGAPASADAYEPAVSADGSVVAFTTRAANLGVATRASKIVVRDLRAGTTRVVESGADADALEPALSADGRYVAYFLRERTSRPAPQRLRSRVMLLDRATGARVLISRRSGPAGAAADRYQSEPVVSADGRRVAFTSTAGNLSPRKPGRLPGVFVRDVAASTTTLLSRHAWAKAGAVRAGGWAATPTARASAHVRAGLCVLGEYPGAS